ncbi:MAG: hypothetical protein KDD48_08770, partial [Bdellovibrionales bacterium]|nr:hypothetical protein [Bdellovibrionales bacterium]
NDIQSSSAIQQLLDGQKHTPTVLLSEKKDKNHLIQLFSHDRLRNLIARNDQILEEEMIITVEKILRQNIFGMEKYLTWGVEFVKEPIVDSTSKNQQVQKVGEFVRTLQCDERFVRLAEVVADEMIMNALYDAPVDKTGKPMYAHLPRTQPVKLDKGKAFLEYGSDGRYFGIVCTDYFGALKAQTVVSYLRKCFLQDDYQVDSKQGGAGVGFYMIFQSISQLVINIEEGKQTETIGLIDIRPLYKDSKKKTKSFNIFVRS